MARQTITTNPVAAKLIQERSELIRNDESTSEIDQKIARAMSQAEWEPYTGEVNRKNK